MTHPDSLTKLEETVGKALQQALPVAEVPVDVADRIQERLNAAAPSERKAAVLPFRRKQSRRPLRWIVGAAVAVLVLAAGGFGVSRLAPGDPPNLKLDLAGQLFFGSPAGASDRDVLPGLTQVKHDAEFRLETTLPTLPEQAPVSMLTFAKGADGGAWSCCDSSPEVKDDPGQPPADPVAAERIAIAWLKEHGHYPSGAVSISTHVSSKYPHYAAVRIEPAPGSEFATMNESPSQFVAVVGGKVSSGMGIWPEKAVGAVNMPLKTADEAWADILQWNGAWLGAALSEGASDLPQHPVMSVRAVTLDRAMVHSKENRFYMIPVVVFHADVTDTHGQVRHVVALVSALRGE